MCTVNVELDLPGAKVIKRRYYGIYDLKHFFQRLFLDLSGYELYAVKIRV